MPPGFVAAAGGMASELLAIPRFIADVGVATNILTIIQGACSALSIGMTQQGSFTQSQNRTV